MPAGRWVFGYRRSDGACMTCYTLSRQVVHFLRREMRRREGASTWRNNEWAARRPVVGDGWLPWCRVPWAITAFLGAEVGGVREIWMILGRSTCPLIVGRRMLYLWCLEDWTLYWCCVDVRTASWCTEERVARDVMSWLLWWKEATDNYMVICLFVYLFIHLLVLFTRWWWTLVMKF